MTAATAEAARRRDRRARAAWRAASIATPLDGEVAFDAGLAAASEDRLDVAVQHLRWAARDRARQRQARAEPRGRARARSARASRRSACSRAHERNDAPRLIGRVLLEAGRYADAVAVLRYASRRFRSPEDWGTARDGRVPRRQRCRRASMPAARRSSSARRIPTSLMALATSLYRLGEFVECEKIAQQLISAQQRRAMRIVGLHAMARALAGQGRHVDAHPYAKAAAQLGPNGELAAELIETMDRIVAQQTPPIRRRAPSTRWSATRATISRPRASRARDRDHASVVGHRARRPRRLRVPHR